MANTLKCGDCNYFYADWAKGHEDDRPYCHWQARCPGDEAPCEEEPYWEEDDDEADFFEDEYDRNHCFPQEQEDELCMSAVYDDMLAYHHREMGC